MGNGHQPNDFRWVNTFVFITGFILGAGAVLLMTPEPGTALRGRLTKGAKTAKEELTEVASQAKKGFSALRRNTQETVKQATSKLTTSVDATKKAIKSDSENHPTEPKRKTVLRGSSLGTKE